MARIDDDPEARDRETLQVSCIVECPECGQEFEQYFDTGVYDLEMLDDELSTEATCPKCMEEFTAEYEGWTHHTDAG